LSDAIVNWEAILHKDLRMAKMQET